MDGVRLHPLTMWAFNKVQDLAIKQIDKIARPSLDHIDLAVKCQVKNRLEPAYLELCGRDPLLT